MRKILFSVCLILFATASVFAQQKDFEWRLGFSMGYSNYYGDLSPYQVRGLSNMDAIHHLFYFNPTYVERPSFKVSLERQLSPTIGLMFSYAEYHFGMSDRYVQRDGRLMLENPNFFRSLNFQNHTRDMGLSFVFKTDNDKLLSSKSLIAPYFTLGFGLINFEVYGDLLDDEGMRYDYTLPLPVNNGVYETDLQPLRTELKDGYSLGSLYTNLGLGFRIRLGNRMELFAQSDFLYTFTDYLDDVSGEYRKSYDNDFQAYAANPSGMLLDRNNPNRGNPNSPSDWIIFHSVGLKFNFGASKKTFSAPRLSSFSPSYASRSAALIDIESSEEETIITEETQATTNNYYNIQIIDEKRLDSLEYKAQVLIWEQQILQRENIILQGQRSRNDLTLLRRQFSEQIEYLQADENLEIEEKEQMLRDSRERIDNLRYSIDSTGRRETEIKAEIDSLRSLIQSNRIGKVYQIPSQDSIDVFVQERILNQEAQIDDQFIKKDSGQTDTRDTTQTAVQPATIQEVDKMVDETSTLQESKRQEEVIQEEQTSRSTSTIGYDDDPQIRRLQEEVDYLRYQRDQLILNQRAQDDGDSQSQGSRDSQERIVTERVIERTEQVQEPEEESRRKNRWWWPFGAGAAAGSIASSQRQESTQEQIPEGTTQRQNTSSSTVTLNQAEIDGLGLAISSAILGTSLSRKENTPMLQELDAAETVSTPIESKREETIAAGSPEIIRDTIYVENEPVSRVLKSKEIIYFQVNQREPDEEELRKLADMADYVKENSSAKLVLTGFADNTGNVNYNLRLAEDRTKAVAEALNESFGLKANQIIVESGGQVVRGTQRAANERDRRVEVKIVMED